MNANDATDPGQGTEPQDGGEGQHGTSAAETDRQPDVPSPDDPQPGGSSLDLPPAGEVQPPGDPRPGDHPLSGDPQLGGRPLSGGAQPGDPSSAAPAAAGPPPAGPPPAGPAPGGHPPGGHAAGPFPYGTPPPTPPRAPSPDGSAFFDAIRRTGLVRTDERWIAGVAGGVARRLGIDPLIVRGLLVASLLLGGVGLVLYGVAWALLPEQSDGRIHAQQLARGDFDTAILGAGLFLVLGFSGNWAGQLWWDGAGLGWFRGLGWIALVVVVIVGGIAVSQNRSTQGHRRPSAPAGTGTTPSDAPGPYAAGTTPPAAVRHDGIWDATDSYSGQAEQPFGTTVHADATFPTQPVPPASYGSAPHPSPTYPYAVQPKPRVLGPSAALTGIVLGLALLSTALILAAARTGWITGSAWLAVTGTAVVLLGAGIIVAGVRGRSSGVLGFLAVVLIIVSLPVAAVRSSPGWNSWSNPVAISDQDWTPTTAADAERGMTIGLGNVRIDLTALPAPARGTVEVPLSVGAGELTLVVPPDAEVRVRLGAGSIELGDWQGSTDWLGSGSNGMSGVGFAHTMRGTDLAADDEAAVVVTVEIGAGTLTLREDERSASPQPDDDAAAAAGDEAAVVLTTARSAAGPVTTEEL